MKKSYWVLIMIGIVGSFVSIFFAGDYLGLGLPLEARRSFRCGRKSPGRCVYCRDLLRGISLFVFTHKPEPDW